MDEAGYLVTWNAIQVVTATGRLALFKHRVTSVGNRCGVDMCRHEGDEGQGRRELHLGILEVYDMKTENRGYLGRWTQLVL